MTEYTENDSWDIIKAYFKHHNLVPQIASYNEFIHNGLKKVISQEPEINLPNAIIKFGDVTLLPPSVIEHDRTIKLLYPQDARQRNLSYEFTLCLDIIEVNIDGDRREEKVCTRIPIAKIPAMVKSAICNLSELSEDDQIANGECSQDPGGYFIIRGNEKVIVAQIRGNYNTPCVLACKSGKYQYSSEVRSMSNETGHSVLLKAMISDRNIVFSLPYIKEVIPVGIVFKAMGFSMDEMKNFINLNTPDSEIYIKSIIRACAFIEDSKQALEYIGKYSINPVPLDRQILLATQIINEELLPHLGISPSPVEQGAFFGQMIRKLILCAMKKRSVDDRDNYSNKRVELAGTLMTDIFRHLFKKFTIGIKTQIEKRKQRIDIVSMVSKMKGITTNFTQCLATGVWAASKDARYARDGVSQMLDRMTFTSALSHLRRLVFPVGKEAKSSEIRQIHSSSYGFICPCETPEGKKIGIVLNFALTCTVSLETSPILVKNAIMNSELVKHFKPLESYSRVNAVCEIDSKDTFDNPIYINGAIIGYTEVPTTFVNYFRELRSNGYISNHVSITYDDVDKEVKIYTDEGRFMRPLLTVNENRLVLEDRKKPKTSITAGGLTNISWEKMLKKGWIAYLDASEIENTVIAFTPSHLKTRKYDYCEIHPSTMLGLMASLIPFPDHSQSPRNCYQCSMGKQALGLPMMSYKLRADTLLHVLDYPQKPIVSTKASEILGIDAMPSGVNAIVAIAAYTGRNQEDSVMFNQGAIERGLFSLTTYFTIECEEKKRDTYSKEIICLPPPSSSTFSRKIANYSLLDENGIIRPRMGCFLKKNKEGQLVPAKPGTDGAVYYPDKGPATVVRKDDVLVGKIIHTGTKNDEKTIIDASVVVHNDEEGTIDRIETYITPNGYKLVKVVIALYRKPIIGDKVASRAAQKGTIGMIYAQEDMPFSSQTGMTPDIIINPNCIPSRMTVNQLIECVLGKACALEGTYGDATPFTEFSQNVASKITQETLVKHGFNSCGWETMINGMTGELIHSQIFMGPTYYQRLKHMVSDKLHARATGALTGLTHQPLEGYGIQKWKSSTPKMNLKRRIINITTEWQIQVKQLSFLSPNTEINIWSVPTEKYIASA